MRVTTPLAARAALCFAIALFAVLMAACTRAAAPAAPPARIESGSWYAYEPWPHDGQPVQSAHFVVYSDAASTSARREASQIAERALAQIAGRFGLGPGDLHPPDRPRLDLYVYHDPYPQNWGARAYDGGLIIWSLDHPHRPHDRANYTRVLTHELTHVVQYLLAGRESAIGRGSHAVDMWFSEGLAEYVSGGTAGSVVSDRVHLRVLLTKYGLHNPIAIHDEPSRWCSGGGIDAVDCKDPVAFFDYYYPMFHLAVGYLVDRNGLGRSPGDVTAVFADMAGGASFATAFETHMGISLDDYQARFFDLVVPYLPEHRESPLSPVVSALVAAVIVLVGGLTTWRIARRGHPPANRRAG